MIGETVTAPDGKVWTRTSETIMTSESGMRIHGSAEMTSEYMVSAAYAEQEST